MLGNKRKYDLIFSIGEACSCTQSLRGAGLQFISYPLDWLFGSNFQKRIDMLVADFDRFIDKKDLAYTYSERSITCDAYYNSFNDLTFNHDFPAGVSLEKSYPAVFDKYNRRIKRLLEQIKLSNSILIVYIETPNCEIKTSDREIISSFDKIINKYKNKNIDLLYITNDKNMHNYKNKKENLTNNISKITANYKSKKVGALPYSVSTKCLKKLLENYKLNLPIRFRISRFFYSILINFIPLKSVRKKIKGRYHV